MMQARQNRRSNNRSLSLDRSTERRILVQRQMRSRLIVITGIRGQDPMQMLGYDNLHENHLRRGVRDRGNHVGH